MQSQLEKLEVLMKIPERFRNEAWRDEVAEWMTQSGNSVLSVLYHYRRAAFWNDSDKNTASCSMRAFES